MTRGLEEAEKTLESVEKVEDEITRIEKEIPQPIPKKKKTVIRNQESGVRGTPEVGDKVYVKKLGTNGRVTALADGEAQIQVGALRLWAD